MYFHFLDEFLEEESFGEEGKSIPRSLSIVFKNLRVFGHFDDKVFEELIKHITYINMKANDTLFKIGESDENLYIVDSGAVNVYSTSKDPRTNEVISIISSTTFVILLPFSTLIVQDLIYFIMIFSPTYIWYMVKIMFKGAKRA